ncbi:hypothetical protein U1Q18_047891, partial [Sarracenia purpurea var. burkii]
VALHRPVLLAPPSIDATPTRFIDNTSNALALPPPSDAGLPFPPCATRTTKPTGDTNP